MFGCGRDRVVSARIQWMAAADAPQRQPAAAQRAVAGDRLHGALRAGWHDTAAWPEQGAQPAFVAAQEGDEETTDPGGSCRSARKENEHGRAAGRERGGET